MRRAAMPNHWPHLRLRKQAEEIEDPEAAAVVRRLAELQELDLKRQSLAPDSPEREPLNREIDDRTRRILTGDTGADGDVGQPA